MCVSTGTKRLWYVCVFARHVLQSLPTCKYFSRHTRWRTRPRATHAHAHAVRLCGHGSWAWVLLWALGTHMGATIEDRGRDSGAVYSKVPHPCRVHGDRVAVPKSVTLALPSAVTRMLSGLMSRCHTPRAWQWARPATTCRR